MGSNTKGGLAFVGSKVCRKSRRVVCEELRDWALGAPGKMLLLACFLLDTGSKNISAKRIGGQGFD